MKEKNKEEFEEFLENVDDDSYTSSYGDCTGLIPSLPSSEAELEAYEQMYHFVHPARNADGKDEQ